jgi:hypothetical protein
MDQTVMSMHLSLAAQMLLWVVMYLGPAAEDEAYDLLIPLTKAVVNLDRDRELVAECERLVGYQ